MLCKSWLLTFMDAESRAPCREPAALYPCSSDSEHALVCNFMQPDRPRIIHDGGKLYKEKIVEHAVATCNLLKSFLDHQKQS